MPATEIAGDFSGFGEQISSQRLTEPRARVPKGTRTYKLHEKPFLPFQRGQDAPPVDVQGAVRASRPVLRFSNASSTGT